MAALVVNPTAEAISQPRESTSAVSPKPDPEIFTDSTTAADLDEFSPLVKLSSIFYIKPQTLYANEKPYFLNIPVDADSGLAQTNVNYTRKRVRVSDIRGHESLFNLDKTGFQLGNLNSNLSYEDFADPVAITTRYYPEVKAFLQQSLRASEVLIFDYQVCSFSIPHTLPVRFVVNGTD